MATSRQYGSDPGPWLVAHRGGAGLGLENRLETFARSAALGVRYFETDVRASADGVAMAFHDDVLDRVTDLRGPVGSRSASELGRAGVPTLAGLIDALGDGCLAVDLKSGSSVRPMVEAVRRTGSAHRVCAAGGWDGWLAAARNGCGPQLSTALGWRSLTALVWCARAGVRPPRSLATGAFVHLPWRVGGLAVLEDEWLARRVVETAAGLGVRVLAWTVDEPDRMRRLLDDGVTGLITDRPDLARDVLVERSQWRRTPMLSAAASR